MRAASNVLLGSLLALDQKTVTAWSSSRVYKFWRSHGRTSPSVVYDGAATGFFRVGCGSGPLSAVNNIVLEPSQDTAAFDSYKVGSARVHRYSTSEGPGSETSWVMWYHGRPQKMENADKLPPLSTGRIGRATSKNGLSWKKTTEGSASEDVEDVSLGLNKEDWWAFDTAHIGLGNVLLPMSTPAVMTEGGIYLMYYFGGSFEDTAMLEYLDDVPESLRKDATVQGMKMRIGVAVSQDGRTWGRVEGDDPSGACMAPFEKKDPNNKNGPSVPVGLEEELYCAWPEVVVNWSAKDPSAAFLMFYSTMTKKGKEKCICYAVSEDGFRWFKKGVCLRPDESGSDAAGCARCCVMRDAVYEIEKGKWKELNAWKMFYEGVSPEDNKHRIMAAESRDGVTWSKLGVVLDLGTDDAWDSHGVGAPHVVRMDDGILRMYYTGQNIDGSTAIGVAKRGEGGKVAVWSREQSTIVFA